MFSTDKRSVCGHAKHYDSPPDTLVQLLHTRGIGCLPLYRSHKKAWRWMSNGISHGKFKRANIQRPASPGLLSNQAGRYWAIQTRVCECVPLLPVLLEDQALGRHRKAEVVGCQEAELNSHVAVYVCHSTAGPHLGGRQLRSFGIKGPAIR